MRLFTLWEGRRLLCVFSITDGIIREWQYVAPAAEVITICLHASRLLCGTPAHLPGVLSLPLMLYDGSPFPARDLAIFIASGVIIVSLVAASLGLPLLLKGLVLPPEDDGREEEDYARVAAAEAAIKAIERQQHAMGKGRRMPTSTPAWPRG